MLNLVPATRAVSVKELLINGLRKKDTTLYLSRGKTLYLLLQSDFPPARYIYFHTISLKYQSWNFNFTLHFIQVITRGALFSMESFSFLQHYAAIFSFFVKRSMSSTEQTTSPPPPAHTHIYTLRLVRQERKNAVLMLLENSKRHVKTT